MDDITRILDLMEPPTTEYVVLKVSYDPMLVTPEFMADHVLELEGVKGVHTEDV